MGIFSMDLAYYFLTQHEFTKSKSCLTNLIAFYKGKTAWMDEGREVGIAYPYLRKALVTVSHNILVGKLRKDWMSES